MLKITDLRDIDRNELTIVEDQELQTVNGGIGFDSLGGALVGGAGGAIGQINYNDSVGKPATDGLPEAIAINAAFGAAKPGTGLGAVGKAALGAFVVPTTGVIPTAIDNLRKDLPLLPQGGFSPTGLQNIKF